MKSTVAPYADFHRLMMLVSIWTPFGAINWLSIYTVLANEGSDVHKQNKRINVW